MRVALDDFGTGFASLESLGGWPVDELKLDMSLVRPIASNASFRTIVRTSMDLAHQLGVKVVAEGVESEAVRSELQALGCDIAQGYFLGRPMPAAVFAEWLRDRGAAPGRIGSRPAGRAPAGARRDHGRAARAESTVPRAVRRGVDRPAARPDGRAGAAGRLRAVADLPLGRPPRTRR